MDVTKRDSKLADNLLHHGLTEAVPGSDQVPEVRALAELHHQELCAVG